MYNGLEEAFCRLESTVNIIKEKSSNAIAFEKEASYKDGFTTGFQKGFEVGLSNLDIDNSDIDWNSIRLFAKFCYINGIDFSYMSKASDTVSFNERVINKFKEEVENNKDMYFK